MGKESKTDQKPPGEEQSRKRLRQWVSHGLRRKWHLWTELVGGREWRPQALCGAKGKKKKIDKSPFFKLNNTKTIHSIKKVLIW